MRRDLEGNDREDSEIIDIERGPGREDKKNNLKRDAKIIARDTLRDIIPNKDFLTQIREDQKNLDDLLDDATFKIKAKDLGYKSGKERKKLLKRSIKEFQNNL